MKDFQLFYPVSKIAKVSQVFGETRFLDYYKEAGLNLKGHNGVDFITEYAEPVRASHSGEVVYSGVDSREGYGVVVRTNEKFQYKGKEVYFKTIYWHLVKNIPVKVGQKVQVGDVIGYSNSTGLSTGNHLHFGLKPQAKGENDWTWCNIENDNGFYGAIDPFQYFTGYYAEDKKIIISLLTSIIDLSKKVVGLLQKKYN